MPKSNTTSNTIQLPNGCYITEMKISPADFSMDKDWFIYYTFFDPEYTKGKRRQIRGMNDEKTFKKRMFAAKEAMESEMELLVSGVNPIRGEQTISTGEVLPTTDLSTALWTAFDKVNGVKGTVKDIKATIKGTLNAAGKLGFDRMPVKNVSRKYFKLIFEQCKKDSVRFTNNRQNVYRKWLKKLYDELIEMEAVETNPLVFIKKLNIVKKERKLPTKEERGLINNFLHSKYYTFWRAIQIFFTSGAREIELMSVKKSDVTLENQKVRYTIKKRKQEEIVYRPITDAALPLWTEIYNQANEGDYLFSYDMKPGKHFLSTEALSKRWKRHIKGNVQSRSKKGGKISTGLNLDIDLYTLKHLNTTELMDKLDREYNPAKDVADLTGHKGEAMIVKIYDVKNKDRKNEKVKRAGGTF